MHVIINYIQCLYRGVHEMHCVGPFVDDGQIVLASPLKQSESQRLSVIFKVLQGCWSTNEKRDQFHKSLSAIPFYIMG